MAGWLVTNSGTLSPPLLAIQTVRLLDSVDSTSPKSISVGSGTSPGWPISSGQMEEMRISSNTAPPIEPESLPALSSMPVICGISIPDQVASQVSGSLYGMPSPR